MKNPAHNHSSPTSAELFDEMLVVMAQRGDRRAAERLFRRWNDRLIRAARRYSGQTESARDIAQESWLGIWKGLGRLRDPARFRSYAFSVLHRRGADHLRRVVRERERANLLGEQNMPSDTEQPVQDDRVAIDQAFLALPADQRLAAHLHFVEGLTLREIAEVQSIPEGTAKSRLFHARRILKAALTDQS